MLYVIIGGSSGLGAVVCKDLSSAGHKVLATYSGTHSFESIHSIINFKCDVTHHDDCVNLANKAFSVSSEITLVYMPAHSVNSMCHKLKKADWNKVIDVSLSGAFSVVSAFLPRMRKALFGRIIVIGSIAGRIGVPGTVAYSTAKEGLKGLIKVVSSENAQCGITANYIELGYMATGLTYSIPDKIRNTIKESIPAKEFGNPSEVTEALVFLSKSKYVSGSILSITGGL